MKQFTSYMDAARYCVARKIDLARIKRLGMYAFKVVRHDRQHCNEPSR